MARLALALTVLVMSAAPVHARQERTPRVELGGAFSLLVPLVAEAPRVVLGAGPRVTVNLTPSIGVDLFAEALGPVESSTTSFGLYGFDLRMPLRRSAGFNTLTLDVGAAGAFSYSRRDEVRVARLDGSVVVHPANRRFRAEAPGTLAIGLTRSHIVARSAAMSTAVHAYLGRVGGMAVRGSIGLTFGPGGYR